MKLQYKLTGMMVIPGISILVPLALLSNHLSYHTAIVQEMKSMEDTVRERVVGMEMTLRNNAEIAETLSSAPVLRQALIDSNHEYESLPEGTRKNYIAGLNRRWMKTENIHDSFIQSRMQNPAALWLKEQQFMQPGMYGEIFLTNRYGAMIATTGKLTTLAHAHKYWWQASFNDGDGKIFFDDRGFDKSAEGYVLGVVVPVKNGDEIIGILKCNMNIQGPLTKLIRSVKHLKVVRTNGLIVAEKDTTPLTTTLDENLLQLMQESPSGSKQLITDGIDHIVAYSIIPLTSGSNQFGFGGKSSSIDQLKGNEGEAWHIVLTDEARSSGETAEIAIKTILLSSIVLGITLVFSSVMLARWVARPIVNLSQVARSIGMGHLDTRVKVHSRDEVGLLAESLNEMASNLQETMASKESLQELVQEGIEKYQKQEAMLVHQSKLAALGEMIGAIAHQWRQPLSAIGGTLINIEESYEYGDLTKEYLRKQLDGAEKSLHFMSRTIDDFRNFFAPSKSKMEFSIQKAIQESITIVNAQMHDHEIEIRFTEREGAWTVFGFPGEFKQVMLNLFGNSKDAINQQVRSNKIKKGEGFIHIDLDQQDSAITITVKDNGGGIPQHILSRVFDPYFTTKEQGKGTGIGLYMSKMIIEDNMDGHLTVRNEEDGAVFSIVIKGVEHD